MKTFKKIIKILLCVFLVCAVYIVSLTAFCSYKLNQSTTDFTDLVFPEKESTFDSIGEEFLFVGCKEENLAVYYKRININPFSDKDRIYYPFIHNSFISHLEIGRFLEYNTETGDINYLSYTALPSPVADEFIISEDGNYASGKWLASGDFMWNFEVNLQNGVCRYNKK